MERFIAEKPEVWYVYPQALAVAICRLGETDRVCSIGMRISVLKKGYTLRRA
jgi:hypothetical protein